MPDVHVPHLVREDGLAGMTVAVAAAGIEPLMPSLRLLKDGRAPDLITIDRPGADEDEPFQGIRCPLCSWRPSPSDRWSCMLFETPEPFFEACGTSWNTFATRGRCPGCSHQWRWTSCLQCDQWSLHDDWYEEHDGRP